MQLTHAQHALLSAASATETRSLSSLAEEAEIDPARAAGAAFTLEEEGLVELETITETVYTLTEEGRRYRDGDLPELVLYEAAVRAGATDEPVDLGVVLEAASLDEAQLDIALSNFARKDLGAINDGSIEADPAVDPSDDPERLALKAIEAGDDLDTEVLDRLERRGLVEGRDLTERHLRLTDDGVDALLMGVEVTEAAGALMPDHLASGRWRDHEYAPYNVEAEAAPTPAGKRHLLRQVADRVKDVLVSMGFREMTGPHIDADFWINDCLFMPQDHPARTHWDRFELAEPTEIDALPPSLVDRVERAHRKGVGTDGEGYPSPWDERFARALALRGHTTSLTARYLAGEAIGDLEPPQRFFSVEKVYRNDTLDQTHLLEFFQIEGWVMAETLSVRDLMGTFEEFYAHFEIYDIEFKPHYNPYTEPSFELFGTHPETGELIEIGNSGIFRDEMLRPLGVEADVMAWGLALERLAMLITGEADIRDVHGTLVDLDFLRSAEVIY